MLHAGIQKTTDRAIHFDIVTTSTGVTLKIWEVPQTPESSPDNLQHQRFIYRLTYKLASLQLAWGVLNQHLEVVGGGKLNRKQSEGKSEGKTYDRSATPGKVLPFKAA